MQVDMTSAGKSRVAQLLYTPAQCDRHFKCQCTTPKQLKKEKENKNKKKMQKKHDRNLCLAAHLTTDLVSRST
jgi:hypothetical protein